MSCKSDADCGMYGTCTNGACVCKTTTTLNPVWTDKNLTVTGNPERQVITTAKWKGPKCDIHFGSSVMNFNQPDMPSGWQCFAGWSGPQCDTPEKCTASNCGIVKDKFTGEVIPGLVGGSCAADGSCTCKPGFGGIYCDSVMCATNDGVNFGSKIPGFFCPTNKAGGGTGPWASKCPKHTYCPPNPKTGLRNTSVSCPINKVGRSSYKNVANEASTGCKRGETDKCSGSSQCTSGCCARPVFWPTDGLQCISDSKSKYGCV